MMMLVVELGVAVEIKEVPETVVEAAELADEVLAIGTHVGCGHELQLCGVN